MAEKKKLKLWHKILIGVLTLLVIGAFIPDDDSGSKSSKSSGNKKQAVDTRPESQKQLEDVVAEYSKQFRAAQNQIQESQSRSERMSELSDIFASRIVSGWTGTLSAIGTNSDGDAYITIKLNSDIKVKTWNNAFSDMDDYTMIKSGTPLYGKVGNMKKGQNVTFSGTFLPSSDDWIKEPSLTIVGTMRDPDFLFRFSDVNPL